MDRPPSTTSPQRAHRAVLILAFFAVLLAGFLGTVFHWDLYEPERENRRLAEYPDFGEIAAAEWPEAFETYFNDHFGFRNTFIHRYRKIMRSAGVSDYRVIYGRDDWLFLNEETIMQDFIGTLSFDEIRCADQIRRLRERREWLAERGIPYLFVIAPNKATIYPDQLPADMAGLKADTSYRVQFMERLPAELNQTVIDLTSSLQKVRADKAVYLLNDTHWNPDGAYSAYTNISARTAAMLPDAGPALEPALLVRRKKRFIGDLANMTVSPDRYAKEIELLTYPGKSRWSTNAIEAPGFLIPEHIPIDNQPPYTVYNPEGHGKALVFHDSFSLRLLEYLPFNYEYTTFIWRYSNRTLLPLAVDTFHPDIVIEQCVERHLIDPQNGALLDDPDMEGGTDGL